MDDDELDLPLDASEVDTVSGIHSFIHSFTLFILRHENQYVHSMGTIVDSLHFLYAWITCSSMQYRVLYDILRCDVME